MTTIAPHTPDSARPSVDFDDDALRERLTRTWSRPKGFIGWLSTTNHKDIGSRYIVTAFVFFALAGLMAVLMRLQLAHPELHILSNDRYNQLFSTHGTTMLFLFAVPVMEGFGLYLVPLMLGTRNVAFPRLNAFGYYMFVFGGAILFGGLFTNTGPDAGWTAYTPLAGPEYSPGRRSDIWSQMITLTEIAALVGAVEIIATVLKLRAPGMAVSRVPLFVWTMLVMSFMVIFGMPAVMTASGMLATDRLAHVNTQFFNAAEGGDNLLYQHLFWFFGHPEVYIIFIPATGFVSAILASECRRPVFGYTAIILSLISTGFIGFGLWVHHMFATPVPNLGQSFFTGASEMIAIPSGVQIFCWIATIWAGKPRLSVPMHFVLGFLVLFVLGGLTGVMIAAVTFNTQVHDTYFIVAHFHYVLIGGAVFPLFGAVYHWFPKITGRMLSEAAGKWHFWLFFIGFNLTFFPMHILGLHGMTRRIYTYVPQTGWGPLNLLATIGGAVMTLGVLVFAINCIVSAFRGKPASANPWNGGTLEWSVPSPAPVYNFLHPPTVHGRYPTWDNPPDSSVVAGLDPDKRELLVTSALDARPDHRYAVAGSSIWPFALAVVVGGGLLWTIFSPWGTPAGCAATAVVLTAWFYSSGDPKKAGWKNKEAA